MTAAKLREIVERMTPGIVDYLRRDMDFDAYKDGDIAAIAILANHATALVDLVATCERWRCVIGCSCPDDDNESHQLYCEVAQANADVAAALDALAKIGSDHE